MITKKTALPFSSTSATATATAKTAPAPSVVVLAPMRRRTTTVTAAAKSATTPVPSASGELEPGELMASQPRTPVMAIMASRAVIRPSAERSRTSRTMLPRA